MVKIRYEIDRKNSAKNIDYLDKINIINFEIFTLEEISFYKGFKQDHRNWGEEYKSSSGRLIISEKFFNDNKLTEFDEISNEKTLSFITKMFLKQKK
nr:hypothetical protein [Ureaplasma canigenitalium]